MSTDEAGASGALERGVMRILRMTLADDQKRERVLAEAFRTSGSSTIPAEPDELLRFVRSHLAPQLTGEIGPHLVLALIDDVVEEIEYVKSGAGGERTGRCDAANAARMAAVTMPPAPLPEAGASERPDPNATPQAGLIARISLPKLRRSVADLVRTTSTKLRAVLGAASKRKSVHDDGGRPTVMLVHSDRFMRATMARALVTAQFDVSVYDTADQAAHAAQSHNDVVVAVADVCVDGVAATLQTLTASSPGLCIVAWTDAPAAEAEGVLAGAGIKRFRIVPRTASAAQLVESVRLLLGSVVVSPT